MTGGDILGLPDLVIRHHDVAGMRQTAAFSGDNRYRYALGRMWTPLDEHDSTKVLVVIGLNPSTADERTDDPTIRRCIGYARAWGHHGLTMLNLFAYRATDPRELTTQLNAGVDIIGGMGEETALDVFTAGRRVLCAWGAHGNVVLGRTGDVVRRLRELGRDLVHLGKTQGGQPRHPLYLKADLLPVEWRA